MNKIQLSVIVAAYNAEKTIGGCLESLLQYPDDALEVIVVNDGSCDKTEEICRKYLSKEKNFKLLSQENKGVSAARNLGIQSAAGEYLSFVDADDYVSSDFFRTLKPILASGRYDIIWFRHKRTFQRFIERTTTPHVLIQDIKEDELVHLHATTLYYDSKYGKSEDPLCGISPSTAWGSAFRRRIQYENNVFFSTKVQMFEDGLFNFHLLHYCKTAGFINYPMYYYVINDTSATNRFRTDWEEKFEIRNREAIRLIREIAQKNLDDIDSEIVQRYYASLIFQLRVILGDQVFNRKNTLSVKDRISQCSHLLKDPKYQACVRKCQKNIINPDEISTWKQVNHGWAISAWAFYEYRYWRHQAKLFYTRTILRK